MAKIKYYHMWDKTTDSNGKTHYVTVVGKYEQTRKRQVVSDSVQVEVKEGSFVEGSRMYPSNKLLNRTLTLGVSICHPKDEFDEEVGIDIAKSRIERGETLGSLETSNVTMLTEDAIMAELYVKLAHITANIDDYISEDHDD